MISEGSCTRKFRAKPRFWVIEVQVKLPSWKIFSSFFNKFLPYVHIWWFAKVELAEEGTEKLWKIIKKWQQINKKTLFNLPKTHFSTDSGTRSVKREIVLLVQCTYLFKMTYKSRFLKFIPEFLFCCFKTQNAVLFMWKWWMMMTRI